MTDPFSRHGVVLCGYDGSPQSTLALRWAGEESRVRACTLVVLNSFRLIDVLPGTRDEAGAVPPIDVLAEHVRRRLQVVVAEVVGSPAPEMELRVVHRAPAEALLEAAGSADLLVIGARGLGPLRGMLFGSVSTALLEHAPCPVVVLRHPDKH